jgi:hypothetical protein
MTSNNKKMMTPDKVLCLSRIDDRDETTKTKTHVSMGQTKGKFSLSRSDVKHIYYHTDLDKYTGLAEMPSKTEGYTMARFDFDYKDVKGNYEQYTEQVLTDLTNSIREFLNANLINTKYNTNASDILVLRKPSYVDTKKNVRKIGFHLCMPNLFISNKDFIYFENEMMKKINDKILDKKNIGLDKISNKPWLVYGQHKNNYSGTYTISYVDVNGKKVKSDKYFKNYELYDMETEARIKMTKPLVHYLPHILSIHPYLRHVSRLITRDEELTPLKKVQEVIEYEVPENLVEIEHDVKALVSILSSDRANGTRDEWMYIGWMLFNISGGDGSFLQIWKDFSSSYPYYQEDECDKEWGRAQTRSSVEDNLNKLHKNAKYDNPIAYSKIKFKVLLSCDEKMEGKDKFETIKLDNIHPDEVINQNNIGSYVPRLDKADIVMMRSNMRTYKTDNLKELLEIYPKILVVSFRVSLTTKYMDDFAGSNFQLYSDFKGNITGDRIICQVDSLYKVRGEFDLLIMDEAVYSLDHFYSFVKKKTYVWEALNQHIEQSKKVIVCDALLDNRTIKMFKKSGRSTHIVDNKWKSFAGGKINYINYNSTPLLIDYIINQLSIHGSLYIPTNSKGIADEIYKYLSKKGVNVGIDTSDSDSIPTSEWHKYKVFITTPTNVAGVSCNEFFGKTIAYGTSSSCSGQMFAQMLLRVRNTTCKEMDIIYKQDFRGCNLPTSTQDIKNWITEKDDLIYKSGLKIDYRRDTLIEDQYYEQYIEFKKNENKSKKWFLKVLKGIFEAHGFESVDSDIFYPEPQYLKDKTPEELLQAKVQSVEEQKKLDTIKDEIKEYMEEHRETIRCEVCKASDISEDTYKNISEKYQKTPAEKLQLRKYYIKKAYPRTISGEDRCLTSSFIKTYEKLIPQYYNLIHMNTLPCILEVYIKDEINNYLKDHLYDQNVDRLHEKNKLLKIWAAHNIVRSLGFESIWDTKEIQGYPYDKAKEFLTQYHRNISVLFGGNSKVDWKEFDVENKDDKKKISTALNTVLKKVCNVGVKNKHTGAQRTKEIYRIQGIEIWKKGDIPIPNNTKADSIIKSFCVEDEKGRFRAKTVQEMISDEKNITTTRKVNKKRILRVKDECRKEADEFLSFFENLEQIPCS